MFTRRRDVSAYKLNLGLISMAVEEAGRQAIDREIDRQLAEQGFRGGTKCNFKFVMDKADVTVDGISVEWDDEFMSDWPSSLVYTARKALGCN